MKRGGIFVVSAPSGAGKTTIVKQILKIFPELVFSVSATTRKQRTGETDGKDYFFLSEDEFLDRINKNDFLEWEKFYDYYYGTLKSFVEEIVGSGRSVLLELDVKGALSIKKIYPEARLIYIMPPSMEVLKKRLTDRNTENASDLKKRIDRAEMELQLCGEFDFRVVNDVLEVAVEDVKNVIINI